MVSRRSEKIACRPPQRHYPPGGRRVRRSCRGIGRAVFSRSGFPRPATYCPFAMLAQMWLQLREFRVKSAHCSPARAMSKTSKPLGRLILKRPRGAWQREASDVNCDDTRPDDLDSGEDDPAALAGLEEEDSQLIADAFQKDETRT
ncbi:hypothetical protein THAOC_10255 [Thalassiosira oceanica]|uniref:Uncharacterized protein n=1 Tax=Thalassiosira oceanica TaxID=159749 RepID=K0SUD0_THAOC|nr:hypothetical protein THAOC_10255 [Thalassiosira oceanica]|eukprot:EJK68554.1 hypothetical protein THAOC_10255 [Thalassiosira oceanica]